MRTLEVLVKRERIGERQGRERERGDRREREREGKKGKMQLGGWIENRGGGVTAVGLEREWGMLSTKARDRFESSHEVVPGVGLYVSSLRLLL